jgi:hypothetical protein
MHVMMEFDVESPGLSASHLARLLLDIQHLAVNMVAIEREWELPQNHLIRDPYRQKYSAVIETPDGDFGDSLVIVDAISQQSPLWIRSALKIPGAMASFVANNYRLIYERVLFGDLERQKRIMELRLMNEDRLRKRIETSGLALDLLHKVPPHLQDDYLRSLISSLLPFFNEHPVVTKLDIDEDDNEPPKEI